MMMQFSSKLIDSTKCGICRFNFSISVIRVLDFKVQSPPVCSSTHLCLWHILVTAGHCDEVESFSWLQSPAEWPDVRIHQQFLKYILLTDSCANNERNNLVPYYF